MILGIINTEVDMWDMEEEKAKKESIIIEQDITCSRTNKSFILWKTPGGDKYISEISH